MSSTSSTTPDSTAGAPPLVLVVIPPRGPSRRVRLDRRILTIGRGTEANLVVDDATVSWTHACVTLQADGYRLLDLRSRNGTLVNGKRVEEHVLRAGDEIDVGRTKLRAETPEATPASAGQETRRPTGRGALLTFREDDTSTLVIGEEEFDNELVDPSSAPIGEVRAAELERRLVALYQAARGLVPIDIEVPIARRVLKVANDLVGPQRAAIVRVSGDQPVIIESLLATESPTFAVAPPRRPAILEVRRIGRPALVLRREGATKQEPTTAVIIPLSMGDQDPLFLYVDTFDPWPALAADDVRFLGLLGRLASACFQNDQLARRLAETNRGLEERVLHSASTLSRTNERMRVLADVVTKAADAILTIDAGGRITSWNRAAVEIFGTSEEAAIGAPFAELVSPGSPSGAAALLERVRREGRVSATDVKLVRRDGRAIEAQVSLSRILPSDEDGPEIIAAIVRDETERRRLKTELIQSGKLAAVGTLAAGIAHEFNNVLAVILGNAELAQRSTARAELDGHLDAVVETCRRSKQIVHDLLAFARRKSPEREPTPLGEIVRSLARIVGAELRRHGIRFTCEVAVDVIVLADAAQVSLVLLNLVRNALDAMAGTGGELRISVTSEPPFAVVSVRDTGTGVPPALLDRIFEPFFTTKEPGAGTGLGLATSYGIVQAHGGRIEVRSPPGEGATFRVLLPLAPHAPEVVAATPPRPELEQPTPAPLPTGPLRVLLVDDDPRVRAVIEIMLKSVQCKVQAVASGAAALEALGRETFDLTIADLDMPRMSGIELHAAMREAHPDVEFLLLTGHVDAAAIAEQRGLPASALLTKPLELVDLRDRINDVRRTIAARASSNRGHVE